MGVTPGKETVQSQSPSNITQYIPPDEAVIDTLAQRAVSALSLPSPDAADNRDTVEGLAEFLTQIARQTAKAMTKGQADWSHKHNVGNSKNEGVCYGK